MCLRRTYSSVVTESRSQLVHKPVSKLCRSKHRGYVHLMIFMNEGKAGLYEQPKLLSSITRKPKIVVLRKSQVDLAICIISRIMYE